MLWSIEAQCLPMALRLPLQTIETLGTSLWQLQVALRPYTFRKTSGSRVIGRISSMDEKRAVVIAGLHKSRAPRHMPPPMHDLPRTVSSARQKEFLREAAEIPIARALQLATNRWTQEC